MFGGCSKKKKKKKKNLYVTEHVCQFKTRPVIYLHILKTLCFFGTDCGIESNIALLDDGSTFNLTSRGYPSDYLTNYPYSSVTCQWFIAVSPGSRIYIVVIDFDLYYGDTLYFGRDRFRLEELVIRGYQNSIRNHQNSSNSIRNHQNSLNSIRNLVSPEGSEEIVITFEVDQYSNSGSGFYLELNNIDDGIGEFLKGNSPICKKITKN